jgi:hypothetical protein
MGCTPRCGQHVLVRTAAGRPIRARDPEPERVVGARNAAVAILGQADDVSAGRLPALAPPAWPTDRRVPRVGWRTRPPLRRRHGDQPHGPPQRDPHGPRGWLGWRLPTPRRRVLLETARLEPTAIIIGSAGPPGVRHRGLGQNDRCAPWALIPPRPLAPDHGLAGVGVKSPAGGVTPVRRCARLVLGRQPGARHHRGLQPRCPGGLALGLADGLPPAAHGQAVAIGHVGRGLHRRRPRELGTSRAHHAPRPTRDRARARAPGPACPGATAGA